jgi:hypothetical protein
MKKFLLMLVMLVMLVMKIIGAGANAETAAKMKGVGDRVNKVWMLRGVDVPAGGASAVRDLEKDTGKIGRGNKRGEGMCREAAAVMKAVGYRVNKARR